MFFYFIWLNKSCFISFLWFLVFFQFPIVCWIFIFIVFDLRNFLSTLYSDISTLNVNDLLYSLILVKKVLPILLLCLQRCQYTLCSRFISLFFCFFFLSLHTRLIYNYWFFNLNFRFIENFNFINIIVLILNIYISTWLL